jgi:hypothetical protein
VLKYLRDIQVWMRPESLVQSTLTTARGRPSQSSCWNVRFCIPQSEALLEDGVSHGFKLRFLFDSNPFFSNEVGVRRRCGTTLRQLRGAMCDGCEGERVQCESRVPHPRSAQRSPLAAGFCP